MLRNPRSHRNRRGRPAAVPPGVAWAEPDGPEALRRVLAGWAAEGVGRIVVNGGDGTVREVLGALPETYGDREVRLAVLPSGKTNALAADLGAPRDWTVEAALASPRTALRPPVEVVRDDGRVLRGFVLGAGVFVDAVALAQPLHGAGLFGGAAVGAALAAAGVRAAFGPAGDPWRAGRLMAVGERGAEPQARFLLLLSTLERLPLGLKPFGPVRPGLKLLDVAAPPRRLLAALPVLLAGRDRRWLAAAGYRRGEAERLHLATAAPFILDGELFEGGELQVRRAAPVTFVAP